MRKSLLIVFCLLLCAGLSAQQQIVENYRGTFVGRSFSVEGIPFTHVNALCTDGDFLYASAQDQIFALDISEPLHPRVLSSVRVYGLVRQMVVRDGTLFAAARESGCWFLDVRNPRQISLITRYDPVELSTGIDVAGNVLFLGTRQNGVECVDITDIRHPVHIRMEKTGESQSVCYRNGILYSGDWGPHCITVIDARDMQALKTLRTVNLQGYGDGVWTWGNYLYVSTGHHLVDPSIPEAERYGNGHGVEIFDISDPVNPLFLSRVGFDRVYSRYNDYWTPRPCSDGRYVICADTVNGLYVVDASDPAHSELISRVRFVTPEGDNIAVNSVAVAKGVVYAAVWTHFGLVAMECPDAYPNAREVGEGPCNASYRNPYQTAPDSRFLAWKPDNGAPVRAVAAKDQFLFAACSWGGLAVLKKDAKGGLRQVGIGPMAFAGDVKVRGKRLYVAEAMDGLGVYEIGCKGALKEVARFKDFRKDGPLAHCLWVYVPSDDWVVASTRDMGNYYISMKDFPQLRFEAKIGDNPGWDKYASISADSQGMYPAMRPYLGICWVNLNKTPLEESVQKIKDARFTLYDGLCPYKNDSFLSVSRGKLFIYSAAQSGQEVEPIVAGDDDFRGLPAWDGGKRLSLTCRIRREIRLVDFTQEQEPRLLWMERTEGFPETSIFWKGKLAVPCGYQGLLLEK